LSKIGQSVCALHERRYLTHLLLLTSEAREKAKEWQETAKEWQQKAQEWQRRAADSARHAMEATDEYVHENPWPVIGSVALGCLALGFILGRRRD
jgi:ElaB/YqjD/DUF883 family membrane-anchored ribosome-binding protein